MASITATVTPDTTPPSVTLVTAWGGGFAPDMGVVERVQDGVATPVRGTDAAFYGTVLDYECAQETVATYRFAGATSAAVMMPDVGVWLIPAGYPELAVQLRVAEYPEWVRPAQSWETEVPGRPNAFVVSSPVRSSRRGPMKIRVGPGEYAALDACLEVTGPMLLSSPARHYQLESRALWVVIGDVTDGAVGPDNAMIGTLTLPLTRVDRPEVVAAESGHRWVDEVGTWSVSGTWADP